MSCMKNVLFISYYFPPAGGTSVQRTLKHCKYLPEFGWQPVILTAREKDYALTDLSLMGEVPRSIRTFRAAAPDLYRWYGKLSRQTSATLPDLSAIAAREKENRSALQGAGLFIRNLLFIPDARMGWLPFALKTAARLVKSGRIQAVLTTAPPFTATLTGGLISAAYGLPWISDYRDPWTQAYFYFKRPWPSRKVEEAMESWLLNRADSVVAVNDRILNGLADKYAWDRSRGTAIPNGFDPDDFSGLKPVKNSKFTLVYTGTLHTTMNPKALMVAIMRMSKKDPGFKRSFSFRIFGRVSDDVLPMLEDAGVSSMVSLKSHVPHHESLRQMLSADMLLLLIPDFKGNEMIVTSKIFEYLRAGQPVLCLSERGNAAEIIRDTRAGITVGGDDAARIEAVLGSCFQRWKAGKPLLDRQVLPEKLDQYNRRNTAKKLAELLDRVSHDK